MFSLKYKEVYLIPLKFTVMLRNIWECAIKGK